MRARLGFGWEPAVYCTQIPFSCTQLISLQLQSQFTVNRIKFATAFISFLINDLNEFYLQFYTLLIYQKRSQSYLICLGFVF